MRNLVEACALIVSRTSYSIIPTTVRHRSTSGMLPVHVVQRSVHRTVPTCGNTRYRIDTPSDTLGSLALPEARSSWIISFRYPVLSRARLAFWTWSLLLSFSCTSLLLELVSLSLSYRPVSILHASKRGDISFLSRIGSVWFYYVLSV